MAKAAGVSRSTVSVVLNNVPGVSVSPQTRERVLAAARRLHYHPNHAARAISSRRAFALGLVSCWDPISPLFSRPVQGMLQATRSAGYALTLCDLAIHQMGSSAERAIDFYREGRIDGVIVLTKNLGMTSLNAPIMNRLGEERIPAVFINSGIDDESVYDVSTDNFHAGFIATEHLIQLGHRQIAFLMRRRSGKHVSFAEQQRFEGYLRALASAGIDPEPSLIIDATHAPISSETGHKVFGNHLDGCTSPPTAVYAINDYLALGAISAAEERGLRVPADLAVVGTDDLEVASQIRPSLTSVQQPLKQLGELATQLLLRLIEGELPDPAVRQFHPCQLVIRDSSSASNHKER